FIGEPWDPEILETAMSSEGNIGFGDWKTYSKKKIERSSINRWNSLSPAMVGRAGKVINPTLIRLGYDPVPVEDDRDSEEARRRYELGLLSQTTNPEQPQ
ncbi:MAG TPA: hypothetical protein VLA12_23855, partial [Planctomycetaceae bacterium]|nr:hypothetical protein [Planctomycetaceae bacterium]